MTGNVIDYLDAVHDLTCVMMDSEDEHLGYAPGLLTCQGLGSDQHLQHLLTTGD